MKKYMGGFSLFFLLFLSCAKKEDLQGILPADKTLQPSVIYGTDDRIDYYQLVDNAWKDRALATVALVQKSKLNPIANGYEIKTSKYGTSNNLCKTEPFYEQVTAAFCSGSLIAPDIVMTAGHCVRNFSSCQTTRFVFDFAYKGMGMDPQFAAREDVYSCKQLIHSELNSSTKSDYALIRLDRKVMNRKPLFIRQSGQVSLDEDIVVIGHPSGLPTKIAGGAFVRENSQAAYFTANLDTYGGNSGSAVFNETTGLVEGILVRGETDFKFTNGCYLSNVCSMMSCMGEEVTRVSEVLKHLDLSELPL